MSLSPDWFCISGEHLSATCKSLQTWMNWNDVKSFGNSAFTTSLIGALAGAFAGAYAAQNVAERSKLRDELSREIRNVNASMTLAFSIVNSMLALKKQHVADLHGKYQAEQARHRDYVAQRTTGQIQGNAPYVLNGDLRSMPEVKAPIQTLQEIVFGKLSATGRPLSLVSLLAEALQNLNEAIAKRNTLIESFKVGDMPPGADFPSMYLGLPYGEGHVNQQYGDIVSAIASYTDDAIFGSRLLCQDLQKYGQGVSKRFESALKGKPPGVTEIDFTKAKEAGLMPKDEDYATWFSAFVERPKPMRRWWQRDAGG